MAKLSAVAAFLVALLLIAHATSYRCESGEQLQRAASATAVPQPLPDAPKMDRGCRCDGLNMMMRELMREGQGQQEIQKMMQMAQNLPNQCNMKPRRCEMEMLSFRY
ncbi:2S sulfur-rich seed storage protein 1-like [Quercus suber]|uniref:2S sulfur-rich seed storage protein 1-like n=1 Tax=Quercus suber TaxID=58331 RepID=UPI0032DF5FF4